DSTGIPFSWRPGLSYLPRTLRGMERWHPIFQTVEHEPGVWTLYDTLGKPQAVIALRRTEAGPRYRVARGDRLLGWATSLKVAVEQAYSTYVSSLGHQGGPNQPRSG